MKRSDLRGQRFGRLVVISRSRSGGIGVGTIAPCLCDCGTKVVIPVRELLSGKRTGCGYGCVLKKKTHCKKGHPLVTGNLNWFFSTRDGSARKCRICALEYGRRTWRQRYIQRRKKIMDNPRKRASYLAAERARAKRDKVKRLAYRYRWLETEKGRRYKERNYHRLSVNVSDEVVSLFQLVSQLNKEIHHARKRNASSSRG